MFKLVGTTWKVYSPDNSEIPDVRAWTVTLDSQGRKWIGTKTGGVAVFDNLNWVIYNETNSLLPDNDVNCIFIDKTGIKWIGTYNGLAVLNNSTWTIYQTKNSGLPVNTVSSIAIDGAGAKWFGTLGGGLVKYNGSHWQVFNSSNSELPDDDIWKIATDVQGNVWIGTLSAGLAKFDGKNWEVFNPDNSNFPSNNVWDILIDAKGNKWVATSLGLAFLGDMETPAPENETIDFLLLQNFPNPFNSSTILTFHLPVETKVKISIYNVLGAQIQVLTNSVYGPGAHQVIWDGKDNAGDFVPSGTYICRLKTRGASITKKMLLLR
ncbi:MAG: two-component regulator propeller domain-containing protein [Candidatus Zhuqueibacterota bacterium]